MNIQLLCEFLNPNAIQTTGEMAWLLSRLLELQPKRILEIGTWRGGTACLFAATGAEVTTIDIKPESPFVWDDPRYKAFVPNANIHLITADAHDPSMPVRLINGHQPHVPFVPFDFLAIDGDHSHESAGRDWAMYAPLARVVGMHDIVSRGNGEAHWWPKWFWNRIESTGARTEEFTDVVDGGWGLVYDITPELLKRVKEFK